LYPHLPLLALPRRPQAKRARSPCDQRSSRSFLSLHVPLRLTARTTHAPHQRQRKCNQNQNVLTILNTQNKYINYGSYWPAKPMATRGLRKNMKSNMLDRNTNFKINFSAA